MTYAPYVLVVNVAIVLCYRPRSLQEAEVLLNMAYQRVHMPPPFCNSNMTSTDFYELTLDHALTLCTGTSINKDWSIKGISTILESANKYIKDIKLNILHDSVRLPDGFRLTPSSGALLETLSLRQLATINKHTKSLMFLQTLSVVMGTLERRMSRDAYNRLTVEKIVKEYSSVSLDVATSMIESWFGSTEVAQLSRDVRTYTIVNITTALKTSAVEEVLKLTMSEAVSMVLSLQNAEHMMFLPLRLVTRVCSTLTNEQLLENVRENCVQTPLQDVVPFTASDKFTLSQLNELFDANKVQEMDYVGVKLHVNDIMRRLQRVMDWPLVISAYKIGVPRDAIADKYLPVLTMDILKRLTDVNVKSQKLLRGILGISEGTLAQIQKWPFNRLLIMEDSIKNAKQLYTLSLKTVFALLNGDVSRLAFVFDELPKYTTLISKYNMTFLQKVYAFDFARDIRTNTIISMVEKFFGISTVTVESYFKVVMKESPLLNQTDILTKLKIVMPADLNPESGKSLYDYVMIAAFTNPASLIDFLQVTPRTSSGNLTLMKDYVVGNRYGITMLDLENHIKRVYYQYGYTSGEEIANKFPEYNMKTLSSYYGIDFEKRKWLDVISYVQKDVAYQKFFDINLSQWPAEFQECEFYRQVSCNLFSHFGRNEQQSIDDVRRLNIEPPYTKHVATTDFYEYRRLIHLTKWDLWEKSFRFILYNMSNEFVMLNQSLINTTIIEHMNRTKLTLVNASNLALSELFYLTTEVYFDALPYYYYFKGALTANNINTLKNLKLDTLNTFKLRNGEPLLFPGCGIILLSWSEVFDYFLNRVTNERLREIRDERINAMYLNVTMSDLFATSGYSEEIYLNQSVIKIAEDVLGITRHTLLQSTKLTSELEVLWYVSIEELKLILPQFKYFQSTLYELINTTTDNEVWVLGSTFNVLLQTIDWNPLSNDTTFVEMLGNLTGYNAEGIFELLEKRIISSGTVESIVGKYRNMLLYRRGMAYFSTQFYESTVIGIARGLFTDIDVCSTSTLYCNETYGYSHCVDRQYGYGYECFCVNGYINFGYTCQDVDECLLENTCLDYVTCENNDGGYNCAGKCAEGYCPSEDSICTDTAMGPACRCKGSKFYHSKQRKCLEGEKFIYVGNLNFLNKSWKKNYGKSNSMEFVDLAVYVEISIRELLLAAYPNVAAIKVIRIGGTIDFLIIFTSEGGNVFPEEDAVKTKLLEGIETGVVLEKLLPAANSSLILASLDKESCTFERPIRPEGKCEEEEKQICEARNCPTDSKCFILYTGIVCRCNVGTYSVLTNTGSVGSCAQGEYFIQVKDMVLPYESYRETYEYESSKDRLEFFMYLEADILHFLQQRFPSAASVQILDVYKTGDKDFVKIDFLITLKSAENAAAVDDAITAAIKDVTFGSLYVDPEKNLIVQGSSDLCELKIDCDDGTTGKSLGANMGVYIGVPVTIMVIILAVIVYLLMRQKPNRVGII